MKTQYIQRQNDERIDELEKAIVDNLPLVDCPLVHRFTDGMYIREIFMPKDTIVTSMIHKTNHPFTISKGKVLVQIDGGEWVEFEAPYTGITMPGTRRVLFILEDCIWTTYHSIDRMKLEYNDLEKNEIEQIVETIVDEIIEPHINYLTGTNIHLDFKNKLNNNKIN